MTQATISKPAQASAAAKTATIYRMVMPKHTCPYGLKALDLIKRKGFSVEDRWLTTREETDSFKAKHDVQTTPQIFIAANGSADMTIYAAILACRSPIRKRLLINRWLRCSL